MVNLTSTNIKYTCKNFMNLIHKRVRKSLRENKLFDPKKQLQLYNDGSKEFIVGYKILQNIFSHINFNITKNLTSKCIVFTNLEREINYKFEIFISNKKLNKEKYVKVLNNVLEEELVAYAECAKIKIPKSHEKINPMIESMQKKYRETKFSLGKSLASLERKSI